MLTFNMMLAGWGIEPTDVRLLRHQTTGIDGLTPYRLWQDRPDQFDAYQAVQLKSNRTRLDLPIWASFVVAPNGGTLLAGLWRNEGVRDVPADWPYPLSAKSIEPEDLYMLAPIEGAMEYAGRLFIDWGASTRTWVQRPDRQDKDVIEISRTVAEPPFPGFGAFIGKLSDLANLPQSWAAALSAARGIYLLSCPRTGELYVGSANGSDGFLGRWRQYANDGHGGNIALKARERRDYQVSILEVAGSLAGEADILALEARWKAKLHSRSMGLNRN